MRSVIPSAMVSVFASTLSSFSTLTDAVAFTLTFCFTALTVVGFFSVDGISMVFPDTIYADAFNSLSELAVMVYVLDFSP